MRIINSLLAILAFFTTVQLKSQATLEFEEAEYDFGIIPYNIPATAHIKVTNTGDEPLVINKVTTSCGCAVAAWDDTPVQPGKQTSVAVTYDAKTMGHFYKTVSIYCNAEPYIFDYDLIGEVSKENADYERLYPIDMGDIRADNNELIFDNVHTGETYETSFYVVNLGEEARNDWSERNIESDRDTRCLQTYRHGADAKKHLSGKVHGRQDMR